MNQSFWNLQCTRWFPDGERCARPGRGERRCRTGRVVHSFVQHKEEYKVGLLCSDSRRRMCPPDRLLQHYQPCCHADAALLGVRLSLWSRRWRQLALSDGDIRWRQYCMLHFERVSRINWHLCNVLQYPEASATLITEECTSTDSSRGGLNI